MAERRPEQHVPWANLLRRVFGTDAFELCHHRVVLVLRFSLGAARPEPSLAVTVQASG